MQIFIAESNQNLRLSLQMLLHSEPGMHVVGLAVKSDGLLTQVTTSQADVLLLDWYLSGSPMTGMLHNLNALEPRPKVIVYSVDPVDKEAALAAGADAFASKNTHPNELITIFHSMMEKVKNK